VGERLVEQSSAAIAPYPFEFHLLADPETINAFALPGGQVFLTAALLAQMQTEAQLAGVLGHEIAHVVARHGAEHLAREQLGNFLLIAVGVAASSDEASTAERVEILARVVQNLLSLRYSRADETESDRWGVQFMTAAGYSPQGLVEVMAILQAAGGGNLPEFFSSHPNPANRIQQLESWIQKTYPNGIPPQLETGRDRFQSQIQPYLSGGTQ
jgi:predicted Zn-dependent protease